ncbi:Fe-S cluster assembly protein SufD, partial [Micrococcus endophyticus]
MTDTVENTQGSMIPGMGEEGEKLTVAQTSSPRAGAPERNAAGSRADRVSSYE